MVKDPQPASRLFRRDRVVVFDLEWTTWPGFRESNWSLPGKEREIVQIGAVALDADFAESAAFQALVRPRRQPRLSDYFVALTGITQDLVERDGGGFAEALGAFSAFIRGADLASWGTDADVIAENCAFWGLVCPPAFAAAIDLDAPLKRRLGLAGQALASSDLPARLGLAVAGRAHDALHDARCVAAALGLLRRRGRL